MKVCVSSAGRFHAFDLARQLQRRGHLRRLYTAYPPHKIDPDIRSKAASFPWLLPVQMASERWGMTWLRDRLQWPTAESFDRWAARQLVPCDVVVALSSYGLHTFRRAREGGARVVCDRGSTHIVVQRQLQMEEYERHGLPSPAFDPRIVSKEQEEYAEADLITVPSQFVYDSFISQGISANKLEKIVYGVDLSVFRPITKEDSVFRVLFVGRIGLRKGVPDLLEAMAGLSLPNLEVILVGGIEPEIRPLLLRFKRTFRHLGFIPRTQLARIYSQASVLVLPSIEEGLALVQAQAMACGVPVVATKHTGAADLFDDGKEGYIVPIRDPQALRDRVLYLYNHPDVRENMAKAALAKVRCLGGWDTYGEATVAAYSRLLNDDSQQRNSL